MAIVRTTLAEARKRITPAMAARAKSVRDEDIDYSDIPELAEEMFVDALHGKFWENKPAAFATSN